VFQDLDDTLTNLLGDPQAPPPVRAAAVMFLPPDRNFQTKINGQTAINLFLHRIRENRELADNVPFPEPDDPPNVRRQPLLRVDCSYLVTAWSKEPGDAEVRTEHQLLGEALQWLSRFPTIPTKYLSGSLNRDDFPLPFTMSARLDPEKVPVDFWTALGIAPRPSFDLTVTIAIDLGAKGDEGPPVRDRELDVSLIPSGPKPDVIVHSVAGTVRDVASTPIANATVRLSSTGFVQERTTSEMGLLPGQYRFDRVPPGMYELRATASGKTAVKMITVPRALGQPDFDLIIK
jgi:hypothetical protein